MGDTKPLICPACNGDSFSIKYEAAYVYSYIIDSDAPGLNNTTEFLPFQYDQREQKDAKQYLQCRTCGSIYPCYVNDWDKGIGVKALQDAIDSKTEL